MESSLPEPPAEIYDKSMDIEDNEEDNDNTDNEEDEEEVVINKDKFIEIDGDTDMIDEEKETMFEGKNKNVWQSLDNTVSFDTIPTSPVISGESEPDVLSPDNEEPTDDLATADLATADLAKKKKKQKEKTKKL